MLSKSLLHFNWWQVTVATRALDPALHPFLQAVGVEFMMARSQYNFIVNNFLFHF